MAKAKDVRDKTEIRPKTKFDDTVDVDVEKSKIKDKTDVDIPNYKTASSEMLGEMLESIITKVDIPEPVYDKALTNVDAIHAGVRNVQNISPNKGINRPVIAGPTQRTKPVNATQSIKSVPGKRTGVFIINPSKEINDVNKTTIKK